MTQLNTIIPYFLFVGLLCACNSSIDHLPEEKEESFPFPVFIDEIKLEIDSVIIHGAQHGNHYPIYFGEMKDTIMVNHYTGPMVPPPPLPESKEKPFEIEKGEFDDYYLGWLSYGDYLGWDSVKFEIQVDTSTFITNRKRKAYPVIIQNLHSDTVYVGYGSHIPVVTEALNENGEWKPIEHRYVYMCGVGLHSIILPPKQYVITSVLVYSGDFKTNLRLKFGSNYSREFSGSINLTQFKSGQDSYDINIPVPDSR